MACTILSSVLEGVVGTSSWVGLGIGYWCYLLQYSTIPYGCLVGIRVAGRRHSHDWCLLGRLSDLGGARRGLSVLLGTWSIVWFFFLHVSIGILKVLWSFISWPKIFEKRNVQYLRPTWCSCFLSFQRSFSHHTCPSWLWHLPFREYDHYPPVTAGSPLVVLSVEEGLNMTRMFP